MPSQTYTLIEKITVGAAGASEVTFTSIPQTYTDLKVIASARADALQTTLVVEFNGSTTGYTSRYLYGDGTSALSGNASAAYFGGVNPSTYTASTFGSTEIYIPNYTSSNYKSLSSDSVIENNATAATAALWAGLWSNTAAITSIKLSLLSSANFVQYSTFYLYGIAKEGVTPSLPSAPYATGGDRILYDGTYWYHAFTSTGTFTPKKGLSCDILVVAGAGGGGYGIGGGGGAGGLIAHTTQSLANGTGYTVTIGAGGAGNTAYPSVSGSDGSNSQFGSLTAANGGGGGAGYQGTGRAGGSAGGGGGNQTANGGTASAGGQGNNGGAGTTSATWSGGGGGGSNAAGSAATASNGGNGGAGVSTYSSWGIATTTGQNSSGTVYYAGGGGGGTFSTSATPGSGGLGGGGGGGKAADGDPNIAAARGVDGTANTGGGGGGGGGSKNGGAGGSGIVIVRYAA